MSGCERSVVRFHARNPEAAAGEIGAIGNPIVPVPRNAIVLTMEQLPGVGGRPNLLQAFESSDRTKFALRDPLPDRLSPLHGHFRLEVSGESAGTILRLLGELDLASSPALEEELDKVAGHASVVVDLRELQFIDSTGLSVLVKANQRASRNCRDALRAGRAQGMDRWTGCFGSRD